MDHNANQETASLGDINRDKLLIEQYRILSDRRINHNTLLWQTPVLFFTAQAFLYNIALGQGNWWSRAIAAFVSFLFSLLTGLLFDNNRAMEILDAEQSLDIEKHFKKDSKYCLTIHTKPAERDYLERQLKGDPILVQKTLLERKTITKLNLIPSFYIWQCGFRLIAYISAFIFLYILAGRLASIAAIINEISVDIKVWGAFFCALETTILLVQKAILPVYTKFEKTMNLCLYITFLLIFLQNCVLLFYLITSHPSIYAYLGVFLISNVVPALFICNSLKYKAMKKQKNSKTNHPSVPF
ncbi:MAG TPA: hypothetical protein PKN45_09260 [Candidatus Limiplasma sp.]|nr:hypothetical protein [Candidatus Limiplasma sp.]